MKVVIDTNVILVANGQHQDVSPECLIECVNLLERVKNKGKVVIDDAFLILTEYQHKTTPMQNKRAGDVFLLWLLKNASNKRHVQQVSLTPTAPHEFQEFPDQALQAIVDPPDRKFIAAAAVAGDTRLIQATDCKWLDWWPQLRAAKVEISFACPDDVCAFYARKFPRKVVPALP